MLFTHYEAVKHVLNVGGDGNGFLPESHEHPQEGIVETMACEESFVRCAGVEHHTDLSWLL